MSDETRNPSSAPEQTIPSVAGSAPTLPPELLALIDALPKWLDGVAKFMAITNSAIEGNISNGKELMIQALTQQTRRMREQAVALKQRWGTPNLQHPEAAPPSRESASTANRDSQ